MNLQKKLDLIETYRNSVEFLSHSNRGIEYIVIPDPGMKSSPVKIVPKSEVNNHGRERT